MKTISVKECYEKTKELFGEGGPRIIVHLKDKALMNSILDGKFYSMIKKKELDFVREGGIAEFGKEHLNNTLILGDVVCFGPDIIDKVVRSEMKILRGKCEDIILRIVNGTDDETIAAASTWGNFFSARVLEEYLAGRTAQDVTMGIITDAATLPKAIASGSISPEAGREAMRRIIGDALIEWIEELPVLMVFPDHHNSDSCSDIAIVAAGIPEWNQPITEEAAIWSSGESRNRAFNMTDHTILYELFGKDVTKVVKESGGYNPNTGGWDKEYGRVIAVNNMGQQPSIKVSEYGTTGSQVVVSVGRSWKDLFWTGPGNHVIFTESSIETAVKY